MDETDKAETNDKGHGSDSAPKEPAAKESPAKDSPPKSGKESKSKEKARKRRDSPRGKKGGGSAPSSNAASPELGPAKSPPPPARFQYSRGEMLAMGKAAVCQQKPEGLLDLVDKANASSPLLGPAKAAKKKREEESPKEKKEKPAMPPGLAPPGLGLPPPGLPAGPPGLEKAAADAVAKEEDKNDKKKRERKKEEEGKGKAREEKKDGKDAKEKRKGEKGAKEEKGKGDELEKKWEKKEDLPPAGRGRSLHAQALEEVVQKGKKGKGKERAQTPPKRDLPPGTSAWDAKAQADWDRKGWQWNSPGHDDLWDMPADTATGTGASPGGWDQFHLGDLKDPDGVRARQDEVGVQGGSFSFCEDEEEEAGPSRGMARWFKKDGSRSPKKESESPSRGAESNAEGLRLLSILQGEPQPGKGGPDGQRVELSEVFAGTNKKRPKKGEKGEQKGEKGGSSGKPDMRAAAQAQALAAAQAAAAQAQAARPPAQASQAAMAMLAAQMQAQGRGLPFLPGMPGMPGMPGFPFNPQAFLAAKGHGKGPQRSGDEETSTCSQS